MPQSARDLIERNTRRLGNKATGDWFRIVNKAKETTKAGDASTTVIYIYDEIGYWGTTAADFVEQMIAIDTENIELHLNSPGGAVFDGVAIYNALKAHPANVTVIVDALAASAASFIAQAASEGQLIMTRNATMMIHDASGAVYGNAQDMAEMADLLNRVSNNVADIYSQRAGGTVADWRAMMQQEVWYSSAEAVDAGLADTVDGETDTADNSWDLGKIFMHAGRDDAPSPTEIRDQVLKKAKEGHVPESTNKDDKNGGGGSQDQPVAIAPVMIGGQPFTDPAKIQEKVTALETQVTDLTTFKTDSLVAGRKAFVAKLVEDKKLLATAKEETEEFVLDLNDEQYDKWAKTQASAPVVPLLAPHGKGSDGGTPTPSNSGDDELTLATQRVNALRRSGLSQEQLEATDSFKTMQRLQAAAGAN